MKTLREYKLLMDIPTFAVTPPTPPPHHLPRILSASPSPSNLPALAISDVTAVRRGIARLGKALPSGQRYKNVPMRCCLGFEVF